MKIAIHVPTKEEGGPFFVDCFVKNAQAFEWVVPAIQAELVHGALYSHGPATETDMQAVPKNNLMIKRGLYHMGTRGILKFYDPDSSLEINPVAHCIASLIGSGCLIPGNFTFCPHTEVYRTVVIDVLTGKWQHCKTAEDFDRLMGS